MTLLGFGACGFCLFSFYEYVLTYIDERGGPNGFLIVHKIYPPYSAERFLQEVGKWGGVNSKIPLILQNGFKVSIAIMGMLIF